MKGKMQVLIWLLSFLILFTACAKEYSTTANDYVDADINEKKTYSVVNSLKNGITFLEAIDASDCIAVAEYLSYEDKDSYVIYTFQVKSTLRGVIGEDVIHIYTSKGVATVPEFGYTYETGQEIYEEGDQYVLILNKSDMLFYEYPQYTVIADIFIPVDAIESAEMYGKPIAQLQGVTASTLSSSMAALSAQAEPVQKKPSYTTAEDLPTIIKESDFVLEVKVNGIMFEGVLHNGNTYFCEIQNVLKGDPVVTEANHTLFIVLMKDSVQVGETYVVMVNQVNEGSFVFTQSSLNSIIDPDDEETMEIITTCIE